MGSAMGEDSQSDCDSDAEHLSRVQLSLGRPTARQKPPLPGKKPAAKKKGKGAAARGGKGGVIFPQAHGIVWVLRIW